MSAAQSQDFVLDAVDLDETDVSRDEDSDQITLKRPITDEPVSVEDVLQLAADYGFGVEDVVVDAVDREVRVLVEVA